MLELHIWGPAFSLPSIDPQCIATIAYLNLTLEKDEWSVIASSNPLLSPTRQLPALRDGRTWIGGFRGIVEYIRKKTNGQADLDAILSDIEKAECTAFSAFIETHGQALLDLSLYVSRKNFDSITRSIYATLLPFPMQYHTPISLRSQAKQRTAPLNITPSDLDAPLPAPPPHTGPHTTTTQQPSILTSELATQIKLAALTADFLAPLQARLGVQRYFFGPAPSTLDCLAVGYLALCFYPELPHAWLAGEMKVLFERMCGYLNDLRTPLIGRFVDAGEVLAFTRGERAVVEGEVPWGVVERGDLPWVSRFLVERVLDVVGWRGKKEEVEEEMDEEERERRRKVKDAVRRQRIRGALTVVGGVAAFVGYCLWSGFVQIKFSDGEDDEEDEEDEDQHAGEDRDEDEEHYTPTLDEAGLGNYGFAGAILGLKQPVDIPSDDREETKHDDDLSPEEEDEIAKDIHAEEKETDEAIVKDIEDHIEGKTE